MKSIRFSRFVTLMMLFLAFRMVEPRAAAAQNITSAGGVQTIALNYSQAESLTLTLGANTATFTSSGANSNIVNITAAVAWNLQAGHTLNSIYIAPWFATTTALANGASTIPVTNFFEGWNGGTLQACTFAANSNVNLGVAGSSCWSDAVPEGVTAGQGSQGNHTDTLNLQIQNVGSLLAGTYTGTLNIEAATN